MEHLKGSGRPPVRPSAAVPADVVGLAGVLQRQAVWLVFVLVGADGDDGLSPALGTCHLVPGRTRAEQHPVTVFCWNLQLEKKRKEKKAFTTFSEVAGGSVTQRQVPALRQVHVRKVCLQASGASASRLSGKILKSK